MNNTPIFIHSLFRAGSTYLFNVFRRSDAGYWCYQEPLHEQVFFAREAPEMLLDHGQDLSKQLRHSPSASPYFRELYEVAPAWKGSLTATAIYDGYFAPEGFDFGLPYLRSLISAAKGRPLLQECRTASRINAIKSQLGGTHIYLWRNPWDQWWSYKVDNYFTTANQMIINAPHHPPAVSKLRQAIGFCAYHHEDIEAQFTHFFQRPLSAEHSYLAFYLLWCLGLKEGRNHADLLMNIDSMSDSAAYRARILQQLKGKSIGGLDFSDCHVPQGYYSEEERIFFGRLEERIHDMLLSTGWETLEIEELLSLRRSHEPACWSVPVLSLNPSGLIEDATRARLLVIRFETQVAEVSQNLQQQLYATEARIEVMQYSRSWRITAPLRWAAEMLREIRGKQS